MSKNEGEVIVKRHAHLAALLLGSVAAVPAYAQADSQPAADSPQQESDMAGAQGSGLDDIVVTATRREERLQDVPTPLRRLAATISNQPA